MIEYSYDEYGVKCRVNPADETDIQPVEPYCFPCGAKTEDCECGDYKLGKWFNEDKGKWEGGFKPKRAKKSAPAPAPAPENPADFAERVSCRSNSKTKKSHTPKV